MVLVGWTLIITLLVLLGQPGTNSDTVGQPLKEMMVERWINYDSYAAGGGGGAGGAGSQQSAPSSVSGDGGDGRANVLMLDLPSFNPVTMLVVAQWWRCWTWCSSKQGGGGGTGGVGWWWWWWTQVPTRCWW